MIVRRVLWFLIVSVSSFLASTLLLDFGSATLHAAGARYGLRSSVDALEDAEFSILLSTPGDGAIINGTVALQAYATDVGAATLQFVVNTTNLGVPITSGTCAESWDTTQWADGTYTLTAIATDDNGNTTTSAPVSVTVMNTALQIFNASAWGVTSSTATISWNTNQPSEGLVDYGTTAGYGTSSSFETSLATSHSTSLTGLSASTTYHFDIRSWNAVGGPGTAGDFSFTTSASDGTGGTGSGSVACVGSAPGSGWTCVNGNWFAPVVNSGLSGSSGSGGSGGCTTTNPFLSVGGGTCVNGGWVPTGTSGSTSGGTTTTVPGGCTTPQPGSGWTCSNGGWLPPAGGGTVGSGTTTGCAIGDPFIAMGGGTCVNGGWLPPSGGGTGAGAGAGSGSGSGSGSGAGSGSGSGSLAPGGGTVSSNGCGISDPFVSIGGGTCTNGGWVPSSLGTIGSGSGCTTLQPGAGWLCVSGVWIAPAPPAQNGGSSPCSMPDPFTAVGGGTCIAGGGWIPKNLILIIGG